MKKVTEKLIFVILFIAVIGLIFLFTFQYSPDSAQLTIDLQSWLLENLGIVTDYHLMRKLAHIFEYFFLGIASALAFNFWSVPVCMAVSMTDQVIKNFRPGREFDITDLPFDFAGYALGIASVIGVRCLVKRRKMKEEYQE